MPDNICLDINLITTCLFTLYNHTQLFHTLPMLATYMPAYLLAQLRSPVNPIRNVKNYFFCPKSQPGTKSPFIASDFTTNNSHKHYSLTGQRQRSCATQTLRVEDEESIPLSHLTTGSPKQFWYIIWYITCLPFGHNPI